MAKKKATKKKSAKKAAKKKQAPKKAASTIGIVPLRDRVVVRPMDESEMGTKTPSGIIIPDTVDKERPAQGEVVAIGEGKWDDGAMVAPAVSVGDKVMFSKYGYDEVKVGGVEYFILKDENILAILK